MKKRLLFLILAIFNITLLFSYSNSSNNIDFNTQGNPFYRGNTPEKSAPRFKPNKITNWITKIQKEIKVKLYRYIKKIKSGSLYYLFISFLLTFIYGIVHAAGPGHRKIILFSYFSSHKHKISMLFSAGFISAAIHAISAIIITVTIFLSVKKAVSTHVDKASTITEVATWLFIALFGVALLISAIVGFIKKIKKENIENDNIKTNQKTLWSLIFITSIVPCPAASMIMIVTLQQRIWWLGIVLIIAMSLGMGITVSLTSIPALFSNRAFNKLSSNFGKKIRNITELILESLGALLMILLGLIMMLPYLT